MNDNPHNSPADTGVPVAGRRRRILLWTLGVIVFVLLSIIVSQQLWLWTIIPLDTASDTVLLYALSTLNFVAFVVFAFIFARNLLKLRRERQEQQLGSKIKTRLLIYFVGISFLPIIAMAVFSYLFLNRSLEKWFSGFPVRVVNEAQEVQREALDAEIRNLRDTASLLAVVLDQQDETERQTTIDRVINSNQLVAVELREAGGQLITQNRAQLNGTDTASLEQLLQQVSVANRLADDDVLVNDELHAVIAPMASGRQLLIVKRHRSASELGETITGSKGEYQRLVDRQRRVRSLGLSTLGLMTLIMLFVSSWVAIHLARGIATPIRALAEASDEIARGNLKHRVNTLAQDELALLAESFNQMTDQLEDNRGRIEAGSAALREKNLTLEERRNYIETVLESLSTGVISLDEDDRVTTINAAAARMLRLDDRQQAARHLEKLMRPEDWVVIDRLLRRARRAGQSAEQANLSGTNGAELPVALTATALRGVDEQRRGVVLVLEDLSELLAAQRAAAWSEVARRMAHEIKNPLTPIQLSAERIAKSYHRVTNNGQNGNAATTDVTAVIDECTNTIAREVAGLKALVDEFSKFARLPLARPVPADLNEVIRHAVTLYEDRPDDIHLEVDLEETLPPAVLDAEQLRRVFVNLIDNSRNSLASVDGDRRIIITTNYDPGRSLLIAEVADTGHGIRADDYKRLFQPYFSTRGTGTGLGLAIVQRIILEHGGRIQALANYPRGAKFVIELPTAEEVGGQ